MTSVYDFTAQTIDGREQKLDVYRGKTLLIVNVASRCGLTPQYEGLEAMYRRLGAQGLVVLGFPCDQFGHQEPGDEESIKSFCSTSYDVTFPMFSKVKVNGDSAHPLFVYLKREASGLLGTGSIKWNFTKFLVDKQGRVLKRFGPKDTPDEIEAEIRPLL